MKRFAWFTALILLAPPAAFAGEGMAIGLRASTLGLGLEATVGLAPMLNLRGGFNAFEYRRDFDADDFDGAPENDLNWKGDFDLKTAALLLDLHPAGGAFRVSGGLVANGNAFGATARCERSSCEVGDQEVSAEDLGTLTVDIDWNSAVPYVGIGFGDAVGKDKSIGFVFDLGLMFQGSGEVDIASDSSRCDAQCQNAIDEEERELQDDAEDFDIYPVISLGISFRLF